jgi:hypothetical protein
VPVLLYILHSRLPCSTQMSPFLQVFLVNCLVSSGEQDIVPGNIHVYVGSGMLVVAFREEHLQSITMKLLPFVDSPQSFLIIEE